MNYLKVFLILVLTIQLCDSNAIKTKFYRKKFNYPKHQADSDCHNCKRSDVKQMYAYHHHIRQPRGINNSTVLEEKEDDVSTITTTMSQEDINILDQKYSQTDSFEYEHEKENDESTITTTAMPQEDLKILDQKYSQNGSGEYKHEVLFSNNAWRSEQGEYEDHNGTTVFVIRGVFQYRTREGKFNTTLYIVDEYGYHNVEPPPQLTQEGSGLVDYRPDIDSASEDCGKDKGTYCIDPKLLALLVG